MFARNLQSVAEWSSLACGAEKGRFCCTEGFFGAINASDSGLGCNGALGLNIQSST